MPKIHFLFLPTMGFLDLKHSEEFDLDSPMQTIRHREIILSKPFLKKLYEEWYDLFKFYASKVPKGKLVELGSGGGFLKEVIPEVITSDVLDIPDLVDEIFYAQKMPFDNASVAAIFMLNVFHHIPDSRAFLKEANRVLLKGGRIVMCEPANSAWARFIYKNFHHEPFDIKGNWYIAESGPLSGSNQALPYIVFERDRLQFEKEFPELQIKEITYHTPLRYLLSGGVSKIQLVPSFSFGMFKVMEKAAMMLSKKFAMFATIIIEKK